MGQLANFRRFPVVEIGVRLARGSAAGSTDGESSASRVNQMPEHFSQTAMDADPIA
jgi:hypothetical protein